MTALGLSVFFAGTAVADLNEARQLYERGETDRALQEIESLLQAAPGDAELRFLKGIIFAEKGRNDDAIEVFAGLTQDYPELPEPYNNLAVLFAEKGDFEKARDSLLAAIQTHPSYSTAHENLGDLYAKMAATAYDRALQQDRANDSARVKLSAVNGLFSVPRADTPPPVAATVADNTPAPQPVTPAPTQPPPQQQEPVKVAVVEQPEPTAPPVIEPEPEPPVVRDESADIERAVRGWASAWESQDVDGYLASYGAGFVPSNGASRAAWANYRRQRLTAPSTITVDIENLDVSMVSSDVAQAVFVQRYRSDNYRDVVRKTLTMRKSQAGWQIVEESSEAI
ncbi:MAG: tetratricopeptide repeat protein [Pseudomonadota bacterium]